MKKLIKAIALTAALILLTLVVTAAADQTQVDVYDQEQQLVKSIVFIIGRSEYFVNGQTPGQTMDAMPFLQNDRTFVPVRYLGYAMGVLEEDVKWDEGAQKATLTMGSNTVEMVIEQQQLVTNGQAKRIDVAPVLKQPEWRTYLPARFVAEGLGYQVDWQNINGKDYVIAWPKGEAKPDVDMAKVQDYMATSVNANFPPGAVRVNSEEELGFSTYVANWQETTVYKAYTSLDQLPQVIDGYHIYGLKVVDGEIPGAGYKGKIIELTTDTDSLDLRIVEKDSNLIGERFVRQVSTVQDIGGGKYILRYRLQNSGEMLTSSDGTPGLPPVDLRNVDFFVVDTTRFEYPDNAVGLLFIKNPFEN